MRALDRIVNVSRSPAVPAMLLALGVIAGCDTTPTITFNAPEFQLREQPWQFGGRSGVQVTTDHFNLYTTDLEPAFAEFLPQFLETTYMLYTSLLAPLDHRESRRMETFVLANRAEWDLFVRRRFPRRYPIYRMITAGGFSEGHVCVVYDIGQAATLSVLAHEGLHQYFGSHFTEPLPAWLNEGLATYCETVEFRKNVPHFKPQHNIFRINHLRQASALETTSPLREFLATNAGTVIEGNQAEATATYYAQAWALIVYLRHGAGGRYADGFQRMLHDVADGTIRIKANAAKATAPSPSGTSYGEAVFRAYITTDLEEFDNDLQEFIRLLCWKN